jgi:copper homeostasis protein (lipoprotein)
MKSWGVPGTPGCARWAGVLLIAMLAGCGSKSKQEATPAGDEAAEAAASDTSLTETPNGAIFAVYEGTLPCADCGGILTELTLFADGTRYGLKQTYLATKDGDNKVESSGAWTTTRGLGPDTSAVVFVIAPGTASDTMRFLVTGDKTIEVLGQDGNRIASDLNYTLTRKDATPEAR